MEHEHDYKKFPELSNTQIQEFGFTSPHIQITEDFEAEVIKVHDGDTITLRVNFRDFDFPLRLLEIDAPEMNAGGEIARDWLRSRIGDSSVMIMIEQENRVGKFGRLLGKVMHGGMDVGNEMLNLGLVKPFGEETGEILNINEELSIKNFFD